MCNVNNSQLAYAYALHLHNDQQKYSPIDNTMDWIEAADILINHLKHLQLPNTQQETFMLVDVFYRYKRYISTY
jgi:hypothetical protein